ncbi:MAG TPA: ABC transporter permease [Bryobacteraceae bacterium]
MIGELWRRLVFLLRRGRFNRELDEEMRFHLEMKGQAAGHYAARRQFGNATLLKEVSREMWGWRSIEILLQDIRYALRMLRRSPGFTTVAVLSLALGIGANTAIFSLLDAVLLKMLPIQKPQELAVLTLRGHKGAAIFSYPAFRNLRDHNEVFSGMFARATVPVTVVTTGSSERATAELVSGNFFSTLGARPALGRLFTSEDDRTPLAHPVAVLSYNFWQRSLGRDPNAIGKTIRIDNHPFNVVGVAQRGFFGVEVGSAPDIWVPMMMQPRIFSSQPAFDEPHWGWLDIMARRKSGLGEAQAQAGLDVTFQQMLQDDEIASLYGKNRASRDVHAALLPGGKGMSRLREQFESPLVILMAVVGIVLLIACANIANLLLARASARSKELAVRLALGASRVRLLRQLLTESLLLGLLGGVLGLVFALWGAHLLLTFLPGGRVPLSLEVRLDARLLVFGFAISVLTGILFGLAPALQATKHSLAPALKNERATRFGLGKLLVIAQVALSLILLVGAGLFIRTLQNVKAIDAGVRVENVLLASMDPALNGYTPAQVKSFYQQLTERIRALTGVNSAGFAQAPLLSGNYSMVGLRVPGRPDPPQGRSILVNDITPNFLETAGIAIVAGRDFRSDDVPASPAVAIINEAAARYFFGGDNPLGKRAQLGRQDLEIVGVAKDAKYRSVREETPRTAYLDFDQQPRPNSNRTLYVRTARDAIQMAAAVRHEVQALDKDLPLFNVKTFAGQRDESLAEERLIATLSGFFSSLALLLACIGLYGVMAYGVVRRTREIGIRMSLGAQRPTVLWMMFRETLVLVLAGIAVGIPAVLSVARLVRNQLFGVTPADAGTLTVATLILLAVGMLAGYIPALRAARVDPMIALRYE